MIVIAGFPMDLALSESLVLPGEVTQFPVESGADISDHIRVLPEEMTLECLASDTPIGEVATDETRQENGEPVPLPSNDAFHKLVEIRAAKQPVTIETSFGTFDNMGIEHLEMNADPAKSGGLFFTVRFKRVNVVTNKRTRTRVRGAMTGGKARTKTKAVDGFAVVNDRVYWQMANPPGGPLKPGFQWAEIQVVKRALGSGARETLRPNGAFTGFSGLDEGPTGILYRYTGYASARVVASAANGLIGIRPGDLLTPAATVAFEADLDRDRRAKNVENQKRLSRGSPGSPQRSGLPAGKSAARFKRPAPPSATTFPGAR